VLRHDHNNQDGPLIPKEPKSMSSQLVLPSLEIRQFRAFRKLEIERLGRVNLIVGKNNVGKTSVLEALNLYANPGSPRVLLSLMSTRDELDRSQSFKSPGRRPAPVPVQAIFHGREAIPDRTQPISIGPIADETKTLSIKYILRKSQQRLFEFTQDPDSDGELDDEMWDGIPSLSYQVGSLPALVLPIDDAREFSRSDRIFTPRIEAFLVRRIPSYYVRPSGLGSSWIARAWNNINLTGYHDDIIKSINIIDGRISQVSANFDASHKLVPIVRLEGSAEPITLRSMGDGMVRLFNLALALVNCEDGILLVDEIENGLHYSVHGDLWRFLIHSAHALNIQVFATTHSWDCIEAFQRAACEDTSSEGYLIRLGWRRDDIVATVYDENDLAIVTRDHIEVR
jgi:energy-coupling factor transporter ATP-binding protein EcfA2